MKITFAVKVKDMDKQRKQEIDSPDEAHNISEGD